MHEHNNGNTDVVDTIGDRLHRRRKELDLTLEELGKAIGVSPQAIGGIEKGNTKSPSAKNALLIADALRCSVRWLVFGKGPVEPETARTIDKDLLTAILVELDQACLAAGVRLESRKRASAVAGFYRYCLEKGLTANTFPREMVLAIIESLTD